jgi:hypothetical protein
MNFEVIKRPINRLTFAEEKTNVFNIASAQAIKMGYVSSKRIHQDVRCIKSPSSAGVGK